MRIITGLGNPGEKYKLTRHNAGFMALDAMAAQSGLFWQNNKKFNALTAKKGTSLFIKPQTYMNNSGRTVRKILLYYKLLPKKFGLLKSKNSDLSTVLTVIHDDIDIELGKYKISATAGSAGHKGVQSIIDHLKTKNFQRIRLGIKNKKSARIPAEKYVLQKFNEEEQKTILMIIQEALNRATIGDP